MKKQKPTYSVDDLMQKARTLLRAKPPDEQWFLLIYDIIDGRHLDREQQQQAYALRVALHGRLTEHFASSFTSWIRGINGEELTPGFHWLVGDAGWAALVDPSVIPDIINEADRWLTHKTPRLFLRWGVATDEWDRDAISEIS